MYKILNRSNRQLCFSIIKNRANIRDLRIDPGKHSEVLGIDDINSIPSLDICKSLGKIEVIYSPPSVEKKSVVVVKSADLDKKTDKKDKVEDKKITKTDKSSVTPKRKDK